MHKHFNEDTRVKFPATIHFLRMGYEYQSLKDAQIDFETKIFMNRFKTALEKINGRKIDDSEIFQLKTDIRILFRKRIVNLLSA